MAKLKPKWMKTDIPKDVKIKLWRIMKDNPTYKSWERAIRGKSYTTAQDKLFTEDELEFINMSRDAYKALQHTIFPRVNSSSKIISVLSSHRWAEPSLYFPGSQLSV
jgi:hypothetical protein